MRSADLDLTQGDFVDWVKRGNANGNIKLIEKNINVLYNTIKILKSEKNKVIEGRRDYVS